MGLSFLTFPLHHLNLLIPIRSDAERLQWNATEKLQNLVGVDCIMMVFKACSDSRAFGSGGVPLHSIGATWRVPCIRSNNVCDQSTSLLGAQECPI